MADAISLQTILTQAAEGLLFPSESEYPFTFFEWPDCQGKRLTASTVLKILNKPADTPIEKKSLDKEFKPVTDMQDWYEEAEKATAGKFIHLKKTLTEQLTNPAVFRVGKIEIDVYIVGKTAEGHWAGLSTKVVET